MKWLLWFLPLWIHIAQAQTPGKSPNIDSVEQRSVPVKNSALAILDVWTLHPDMWTELPTSAIHPTVDSLLTPTIKEKLLQQINARHTQLGKDTLLLSEISDKELYPNPSIILKI